MRADRLRAVRIGAAQRKIHAPLDVCRAPVRCVRGGGGVRAAQRAVRVAAALTGVPLVCAAEAVSAKECVQVRQVTRQCACASPRSTGRPSRVADLRTRPRAVARLRCLRLGCGRRPQRCQRDRGRLSLRTRLQTYKDCGASEQPMTSEACVRGPRVAVRAKPGRT